MLLLSVLVLRYCEKFAVDEETSVAGVCTTGKFQCFEDHVLASLLWSPLLDNVLKEKKSNIIYFYGQTLFLKATLHCQLKGDTAARFFGK
jgi:hypothetical protein